MNIKVGDKVSLISYGRLERWYDNGQLIYRYNFLNGKIVGLYEGWYLNRVQNMKHYKLL